MKPIILIAALLLQTTAMMAQDVDIDKKTSIVQVDGKDAFMLVPKNKQFMESDFSLQNLQQKELAYLKLTKYGNEMNYQMVFTKTGNQCMLTGFATIGLTKRLAKMIGGANLVQGDTLSFEEERKFVLLHNGTFIKDPAGTPPPPQEQVIQVSNERRSAGPADISIKENKIYNNSEMVGIFKQTTDNGLTVINVYNNNDVMVCKATHPDADNNADWSLMLDGKAVTLLYNTATPFEKLFKYLAEKGYL
jgi:hypothetical protein